MNIIAIKVTKGNLMDIINDESVYVISHDWFHKDTFTMKPIKKADVGDLLSDKTLVVKITNE